MPSSALNTFMQWLGRSNALFRIAQAIPELHANPAAPLMLACWGLGEVIRYPWYALTEAGACPGWLTWLRYSAFVPVYPLGVAAEMALMWRALPLIRARRVFSLAMPNKLNFAFDYSIFMAVRNTVLCVWGGGRGGFGGRGVWSRGWPSQGCRSAGVLCAAGKSRGGERSQVQAFLATTPASPLTRTRATTDRARRLPLPLVGPLLDAAAGARQEARRRRRQEARVTQ